MSAVRVCSISDAACSRGCGLDRPCAIETSYGTTATTGHVKVLKLADLEKTVEKLRGLPPVKWMLVSPEGHVWSDEDPMVLARILAQRKYGLGGFANNPVGDAG